MKANCCTIDGITKYNCNRMCTVVPKSLITPNQEEAQNQIQVLCRVICQFTSGHLSSAADSKTSPMNPIMCIVLHLANIARLAG